jgi:hypothetical protein
MLTLQSIFAGITSAATAVTAILIAADKAITVWKRRTRRRKRRLKPKR